MSDFRLYNTLTRQEEPFAPGDGQKVRMYACGLTVYARGHVGNFRTFVAVDLSPLHATCLSFSRIVVNHGVHVR